MSELVSSVWLRVAPAYTAHCSPHPGPDTDHCWPLRECYHPGRKYLIQNTAALQHISRCSFTYIRYLCDPGLTSFTTLTELQARPVFWFREWKWWLITIFVKCWQLSPVIKTQARYRNFEILLVLKWALYWMHFPSMTFLLADLDKMPVWHAGNRVKRNCG